MGLNGIGGANMDFADLGGDCDSTADVYLYSGGLFVLQEIEAGVDYRLNTGLYQDTTLSPVSFIPDPSGPPASHFIGPDGSDAFFTGRFVALGRLCFFLALSGFCCEVNLSRKRGAKNCFFPAAHAEISTFGRRSTVCIPKPGC